MRPAGATPASSAWSRSTVRRSRRDLPSLVRNEQTGLTRDGHRDGGAYHGGTDRAGRRVARRAQAVRRRARPAGPVSHGAARGAAGAARAERRGQDHGDQHPARAAAARRGVAWLFGGEPRRPESRRRVGATVQETGFPVTLRGARARRTGPRLLPEPAGIRRTAGALRVGRRGGVAGRRAERRAEAPAG